MGEHESPGQRARRLLEGATEGPWYPVHDNEVSYQDEWYDTVGIRAKRRGVEVFIAEVDRDGDSFLILGAHDLARDLIASEEREAALQAQVADLQSAIERMRPVVETLAAACDVEGDGDDGEPIGVCDLLLDLGRTDTSYAADAAWLRSLLPTAPESVPDLAPQPPGKPDDLGFTVAPARYTAHGRETIDRMRDLAHATFGDPDMANAAFAFHCRATALKYDDRAGLKGPAGADREKAAWYRQMAGHVDGFAADPREGRADFVPYAPPLNEALRAEIVWLEAEMSKPPAGPWHTYRDGCAHRLACSGDSAASLSGEGWWVNAPSGAYRAAGRISSGPETGDEGRRLADAAAVAAGWRLCDRATDAR